MGLTFCSFSSGSSGNCYLVQSDEAAILIDAGISGRRIMNSLKDAEVDADKVSAVLITHEHTDHVRSLKTLTKRMPHIRAYANRGTWQSIRLLVSERQQVTFQTGEPFAVSDIEVRPFLLSHDAREPVGFSFLKSGKQISILTDTGWLCDDIHHEIKGADILVIEANHDVEMLRIGRYPYFLKQRILGKKGHLSNADAADAICKILSEKQKYRHVLLAHLSKENNFPEMAYQTIKNLLEEKSHFIDMHIGLNIIAGDKMSALYSV
jgi:phosphoribosyl 1,2-cyclic phosphodiesterase